MSATSAEQQARDLLESYGLPDAQTMTAGDVVELANLIADANAYRRRPVERIMGIRPAYDCIGVQPCVHGSAECTSGTARHGRHNAELWMTVRGPGAEITLVVGTGWDLPTVPPHHRLARLDDDYPRGRFVEFHTAQPRHEGQDRGEPRPDGTCKNWAACYLTAGYTMSDEPARLLVEKGSDATWEWLENLYNETQRDMAAVTEADR